MSPLHVAVVCEYPVLNGGEYSWLAALPYLRRVGIAPIVVTQPPGPLIDQLMELDVAVEPIRWRDEQHRRLPQETVAENLRATINRIQPDLVHANSLSTSRLLGLVADRIAPPTLGHIRDIVGISRKAARDLNRLDRILVVSQATRRWHQSQGVDPGRMKVQYNGVDLRRFAPAASSGRLHRLLQIDPTSRMIGTIGQIGLRKGTDCVLAAARLLAESHPTWHWVVIGERNSIKEESAALERKLRGVAVSEPLRGRVHFLGRRNDVPDLLGDFSLIVHAARQEPLGRILLEAAAAGLPIVATRVGGTEEIFPDGMNCAKLVPPDDPFAIASQVSDLIADDRAAWGMGVAARQRILAQFDVAKRGPELAKHYMELTDVS